MLEKLHRNYEQEMAKAVKGLEHVFGTLRTGRASLSLLDGIEVDAYGSRMPLIQLASLNTPDASTITIQPFDPSQIQAIEKAIRSSDIGINPSNDGRMIRLNIPALTEERRKELCKLAQKYAEEHRVGVRQARHHMIDELKKLEKDKEITEDQRHQGTDEAQKMTDKYIAQIDADLKKKEAEIMEV